MKGLIKGKEAENYDEKLKKYGKAIKVIDDFIVKNVKKNSKVCDLCCGTGRNIELLNKKVKEIIGVDLSEDMIKVARSKFKDVKIKCASASDTKLKSGYFDYVIIRMGLHHLKDKEGVVKEAHRILKDNGKLIVIDRFYLNWFKHHFVEILNMIFKFDDSIFVHAIKSRKYNERVLERYFRIVKKKYIPVIRNKTDQGFMYVLEK